MKIFDILAKSFSTYLNASTVSWMPSGSWKWMPLEKSCFLSKFAFATTRYFLNFFSTFNFSSDASKLSKLQRDRLSRMPSWPRMTCQGAMVYHGHMSHVQCVACGEKKEDCAIGPADLPQFRRQVSGTHGIGLGEGYTSRNWKMAGFFKSTWHDRNHRNDVHVLGFI